MRIEGVLRSTSFRLSAIFAGLLVAAFLAAGAGVWIATRSIAERQVREHLLSEMASLRQEIATEGMEAGIAAIRTREMRPSGMEYRLTAQRGALLAGRLDIRHPAPHWSFLSVPERDGLRHGQDDIIVLTERLPDGSILSIGDDLERGESVRIAVIQTLYGVGGLSALVFVALGLWITRHSLGRMQLLSETLAQAAAGNLSARAHVRTPPQDDLDQLAASTNAMLDQIELLVRNVRRVSADVAHDLRTPLMHVRRELDRAAAIAPDEARAIIGSAQSRLQNLLRTFDAMLRLAEIEAGGARSRFTDIDLAQIAERVADAYRPDIEAQGGMLTLELDQAAPAYGDEDLIAQALANLIENAMRHAGPNARITLEARRRGQGWSLSVADNGPGVAPELREKIFSPFFRLDQSRSSPGAGLGLAIVAAVAKLHEAALDLEDAKPGLIVILTHRS